MNNKERSGFRRLDWPYHYVAAPLAIVVLVFSVIELFRGLGQEELSRLDWLLFILAVCLAFAVARIRLYATKTQDRIVRMEENFRHYRLTGRTLDPRITVSQIISLRYAGDDEFPSLCDRAVTERMSRKAIRSAIKDWRPDMMRI
ncbi:DUF6526 family protein [Paenibacillus agricola]|uniref:ABC transporter permease n=1 Tax=Paenibacillus agricola TaxID=2716264 RepID=A0ABX0JDW4_9BACL|nr:DUF6526 family protein [Paenibacillus agricola]NHN34717.1 ABC transporter permease [Paenibacillus agricola]